MITLVVYKDLTGFGFQKILRLVNVGFHVQLKSFAHNTKIIRNLLFRWAQSVITLSSTVQWNLTAKILPTRKGFKAINLIIDSIDVQLCGKESCLKHDPHWSFKLNAPGQ